MKTNFKLYSAIIRLALHHQFTHIYITLQFLNEKRFPFKYVKVVTISALLFYFQVAQIDFLGTFINIDDLNADMISLLPENSKEKG